jgi:broad specificity phosphatase PhoE
VETEEAPPLAAWWGPDAGEPLDAVLARTGTWLDTVTGRRAVVVASPPIVRALVVHALAAPAPVFWRIDVAVLSVSVLTRADVSRASPRASEQGGDVSRASEQGGTATWRVRSISDR